MFRHLVLIDFQSGFLRSAMEDVRRKVQEAVCSPLFSCVTATKFVNTCGSPWEQVLKWNGLKDAREQALAVSLPPTAYVFPKTTYGLDDVIIKHIRSVSPRQEIFLAGLETDICVTVCAAQLFDVGLAPSVLTDCTATTRDADHRTRSLYSLGRIVGRDRLTTLDKIAMDEA